MQAEVFNYKESSFIMSQIIPVAGTPGLQNIEGEYIALKPLTEAIGIGYTSQFEKLQEAEWATVRLNRMVGADGKQREMATLHKDSVPMWLATIQPGRIKEEVRPVLIAYQKEAAKALNDYFTQGAAVNPRTQITPTIEAQRLSLIAAARDFGFIDPQHAQAQAQIQIAIGLGQTPAIEQVFIYCEAYLLERGCDKKFAQKYRGAFGKKVSELYQGRHGVKPPRHQGEINGKITSMFYYTPKDKDLLDQVFDSYIAPKLAV